MAQKPCFTFFLYYQQKGLDIMAEFSLTIRADVIEALASQNLLANC